MDDEKINRLITDVAVVLSRLESMEKSLNDFKTSFVTKESFAPVKNIAYTLVFLIGAGVIGAVLKVVLK